MMKSARIHALIRSVTVSKSFVMAGTVATVATVIALAAPGALALPPGGDPPDSGPPRDCGPGLVLNAQDQCVPIPVHTTITGISPSFAWSGDTITLTGTGLYGGTVTVNGLPATISSATGTNLAFVVPPIVNAATGPMSVPVAVSNSKGTASTSFTLSPTLQASLYATYGDNAQFDQGTDGSARATATLDRYSGSEHSKLTVTNEQEWLSLVVNMSVAWLDGNGKVIGFTDPDSVTATGCFYHWPSSENTETKEFSHWVDPGFAPFVRSARIILVRDHRAELISTLTSAVAEEKTISSVLSALAKYAA